MDWEAICVDDGSTDGSGAILDEYAAQDKRFRVIHQKNAGVSAARNMGIDSANGKYICFIDGDDYVGRGWLKDFQEVSTDSDLVLGGVERGGAPLIKYSGCKASQKITGIRVAEYKLMEKTFACARCYKTDLIKSKGVRFPYAIPFSEDAVFNMKFLLVATTFSLATGCNYHYRTVAGSASRTTHPYEVYVQVARQLKLLICGIDDRFGLPDKCFKQSMWRSYVGHLRLALISAYANLKRRAVRIALIKLIQHESKEIAQSNQMWGVLRRCWLVLYANLPPCILELIIRLSPCRLG